MATFHRIVFALVLSCLAACGGGDPEPNQDIGDAICMNSDGSPCPPAGSPAAPT